MTKSRIRRIGSDDSSRRGGYEASVVWVTRPGTGKPYRHLERPDRPMVRFSADLGPDAVAGGRITVAISPDGTRIVYPFAQAALPCSPRD